MSKDALEVLSAQQAGRIDRIKDYHAQAGRSATDTKCATVLCAMELIVLKEATPHGQFLALRERYFPELSARMCQYYMKALNRLTGKNETISHLIKDAQEGPLSDAKREKLLAAVDDASDAATATDLLRATGALREPTPAGGYRPDLKALKKFLEDKHPTLVGTKWPDLPKDVQDQFKKEHKPKIDPKLVAESKRQKADAVLGDLGVMLTEQEFKKYWTPEQCLRAKDLFWDFHQKLVDLHHRAPKQPKRKAAK